MIRTALTAITSAAALFAVSEPFDPPVAQADSTEAYCTLSWHDHTKAMIEGPCIFSQYQGNVYIDDFHYYKFAFPYGEDGKTYTRDNKSERISFNREGQYTLNVFWEKPAREPGGY